MQNNRLTSFQSQDEDFHSHKGPYTAAQFLQAYEKWEQEHKIYLPLET
jgi:hypothetical protein